MPFYDFLCPDCGLKTEKMMKTPKDFIDCPSCQKKSFLYMDDVQFCYNANNPKGLAEPQATGFTSYDTDFDKVIGTQSKENWEVINERQAYKHSIMKEYKVPSRYLSRNPDGSYRVLTDKEVIVSVNAEKLATEVVLEAKKLKKG